MTRRRAPFLLQTLADASARGARIVFDTNFRPRGWPVLSVARHLYGRMFDVADIVLASSEDLSYSTAKLARPSCCAMPPTPRSC